MFAPADWEGGVVPRITTDLSDAFVGGFLGGGEEATLVLALVTMDLFLVAGIGWLILRQTPLFDGAEWQLVCDRLPAGTTIDPDGWERVLGGETEILFVPQIGAD